MFKNLDDASQQLCNVIPKFKNQNLLFLAISDGGEEIASQLSLYFKLPYKRLFIEPIFCPKNQNCEIAMVTELQNIKIDKILQDAFQLDQELLNNSIELAYDYKLIPKLKQKRGEIKKIEIDKSITSIILVDETIETGLKMETAIETVVDLLNIEKIFIATPIIPKTIFEVFESMVEQIFYIKQIEIYTEIGDYYLDKGER